MSAPVLTSFAIAGAGKLGLAVIDGLVAASAPNIMILSRNPDKLPKLSAGVKVAKIDYDDTDGIVKVLKEHKTDCLVSTVSTKAMASQYPLAEAAKRAGIKLFVPSEFGFPTDGAKDGGLFQQKEDFKNHLMSLGVPFMRCYNGAFTDYMPYTCGYKINHKVNIIGNGDVPISFTAVQDVGGFIAHAITTHPLHKIKDKTYRLEGHRATFLDIARILDCPYENKLDRIPAQDEEKAKFFHFMQSYMDTGRCSVRYNSIEDRHMSDEEIRERGEDPEEIWPGHVWKRIGDLPDV